MAVWRRDIAHADSDQLNFGVVTSGDCTLKRSPKICGFSLVWKKLWITHNLRLVGPATSRNDLLDHAGMNLRRQGIVSQFRRLISGKIESRRGNVHLGLY